MLTLDILKEKLTEKQRIVVTTHYKPDGDAMGSSLGLYYWLQAQGHEVSIIVPSDYR
jgi:phosphoesterase RecJ-like protein